MGGSSSRRCARWVVVFALLLCATSAAPVFADPEPAPSSTSDEPPSTSDESLPLPSDEEFTKALEEAEREEEKLEAERENELATPAAEAEREASRDAYADLSAAGAQNLLLEAFPEDLQELNADPARVLSDLEVEKTLGVYGARVAGEEGESELVESPIPIESAPPGGEKEPVDLSLERSGAGFVPENPLEETRLPDSAAGPIRLGGGVALADLPGGDASATRLGDKNLFFAETDTTTDTLLAPIASGVEVFEQLRSTESPEQFRYGLSLPEGATLRSDGQGGAEVLDASGSRTAAVPAPTAVDAQGTEIPLTLSVDGDAIVLDVSHRSRDVAYPVLVDPILENWEGWYAGWNTQGLGYWAWSETADYENALGCIVTCWGSGLYARSRGSSYVYGANTWGQWLYTAANSTAFISRAVFQQINGDVHNCFEYQPHGYVGIYNVNSNTWSSLGTYSPTSSIGSTFDTNWYGGNGTRLAVVGIGTAGSSSSLKCGHDFFVGGTMIWEDDPENPTISSVTGVPSGWVTDATPFTIKATTSDPGLGVRFVTISPEGTSIIQDQVGCSGLAASRCPATRNSSFNLNGTYFDQGKKTAQLSVEDPLGKVTNWYTFETKVDRTPPEVTLSGQLAAATNEGGSEEHPPGEGDELSLPVYNLKIEAKDGSNASPSQMRSGVKNIEIFLDKKTTAESVPWQAQSCPESSCAMTQTYTLKLDGLSAGSHTLRVIAVDQVGKELERKIEFEYLPATGIKDQYVLQRFPLPDGQGNEAEEESPDRPELAVNVMNGNLVYREQDVEVDGAGADLEVERYYNSMLPSAENTEWGDGWTLAQTPDLEPIGAGEGSPKEAELLESSGGIEDGIDLPTETGEERFDPALQATLTKEAGGYELTDETGEAPGAVAFDSSGQPEELRSEGYAKVDYGYLGGALDEIAVKDPASASFSSPLSEDSPPSFVSSKGETGTYPGQFRHPADVGLGAKGKTLFVLDQENNRIEKFDTYGYGFFDGEFGSYGSGNGLLNHPAALALDTKGNVWVADTKNNRIEKFSPSGTYLAKFGSAGSGNGQLSGPEGVAIDAKGNVWVSDTGNGRLEVFSEAGAFVKSVASKGSDPGQLDEPIGIDVGPAGKVFVADSHNNRIAEFSEAGAFIDQFGSYGQRAPKLNRPVSVEVDLSGNVWVGDQGNGRVEKWSEAGEYLGRFGTRGSGTGQFAPGSLMGIESGPNGDLWVADAGSDRVQRWRAPSPVYSNSFGTSFPADVALGSGGNVWVLDASEDLVTQFDSKGEYLSQFGTHGWGPGEFIHPTSLALDPEGDIWVADAGAQRVQEFSSEGEFLTESGPEGWGFGSFSELEGIAVDQQGHVWIADTNEGRILEFTQEGELMQQFSAGNPTSIAIGPDGNVWTTGSGSVVEHSPEGEWLRSFGDPWGSEASGSDDGYFSGPKGIDIDANGEVWVGDQGNDRVEAFNQSGQYITKFGTAGSGTGQFEFGYSSPIGIATGPDGKVWVTDAGNGGVQEWQAEPGSVPAVEEDDPAVQVSTANGLISKVEGEEAGRITYAHSTDDLVSRSGPQGTSKYTYDSAGRMTKVELANGTWGAITYNATYGRVASVTVDPAGSAPAKTTYFSYSDEPRRTTVTPEGEPAVTYDIGADGSVLRWWNAVKPPEFNDLAGSLYANRETASPIPMGDHNLVVEGYSAEGIASIQVIANGNQLIDEKTCAQDYETPGTECVNVAMEWVTNTANFAPGILYVEAVITDRLGASESRRFWVNIPQPPPPPAPGSPVAPTFEEILHFREEYGLDIVDPVTTEQERNDRIFNLIDAWWAGDPVARATKDKWGVPLRTRDVEELEYRKRYLALDGPMIAHWAETYAPLTYAGYYIDHRQGGIIHVGFTTGQVSQVEALKQQLPLLALNRIDLFETKPLRSLGSLYAASQDFNSRVGVRSDLTALLTTGHVDIKQNSYLIGTTNVGPVKTFLTETYGASTPVTAFYDPHKPTVGPGRPLYETFLEEGVRARPINNRLYAGDWIRSEPQDGGCTLAFGAWEDKGRSPSGERLLANYGLTAGHCWQVGIGVYRAGFKTKENKKIESEVRIGTVERRSNGYAVGAFHVDSEAIRLSATTELPRWIYWSQSYQSQVNGAATWQPGEILCYSAAWGGTHCGRTGNTLVEGWYEDEARPRLEIELYAYSECGSSGSPVWDPVSGSSVAILVGGIDETFCKTSKKGPTFLSALLSLEGQKYQTEEGEVREILPGSAPGVLAAPSLSYPHQLQIVDPIR